VLLLGFNVIHGHRNFCGIGDDGFDAFRKLALCRGDCVPVFRLVKRGFLGDLLGEFRTFLEQNGRGP
jgi:hypothetical protein